MIAGDRSAHLFDFGEEIVEVVGLGAFTFAQPSLHQTPEAKSVVVHTYHAATMRTFVVLVWRP
jgi:hypothetical protein